MSSRDLLSDASTTSLSKQMQLVPRTAKTRIIHSIFSPCFLGQGGSPIIRLSTILHADCPRIPCPRESRRRTHLVQVRKRPRTSSETEVATKVGQFHRNTFSHRPLRPRVGESNSTLCDGRLDKRSQEARPPYTQSRSSSFPFPPIKFSAVLPPEERDTTLHAIGPRR